MAKEDLLEMDGTVLERLPDARYRVRLDNGHETLAYMAGRVKKNRIRILAPGHSRASPVRALAGDVAIENVRQFQALGLAFCNDARYGTANGTKSENGDTQRPKSARVQRGA